MFWYEMNWVLLIVATIAIAVFIRKANRQERRRAAAGWLMLVAAPATVLFGSRTYLLSHATGTYSGMEPHLGTNWFLSVLRCIWFP